MPKLIVVTREGEEHEVDAKPDLTVMEIIRDAGFDDLQALCGGSCSCATCHVHVLDEAFGALLPPISPDEDELLDSTSHRDEMSRLSCQLPFGPSLDGLRVRIAAED